MTRLAIQVRPRRIQYHFPSTETYVDALFDSFGPFMKLVQELGNEERACDRTSRLALRPFNQSSDRTLVLRFDYIEAVATKRSHQ